MPFKNLKYKSLFLFILAFGTISSGNAQDTLKSVVPKIEWQGYRGMLLAHSEKMSQFAKNPYAGQEFKIAFQTTGKYFWHKLYNYPIYGFGFYSGYYFNDALGNPFAFFSFLEIPFWRGKQSYLSTCWGVGAAFHFNEYDSVSNPTNTAIGSDLNVYVDFGLNYRYKLNKRFELGTGIKFQHFSNGAMKLPNLGLNMIAFQAILAYSPGKTINKFALPEPIELPKGYEVTMMYAGGWRAESVEEPENRYYNTTISFCISKRINYKRNIGIGADAFKNNYLVTEVEDTVTLSNFDLTSYALFAGSDLIVNRFRMSVQLGVYVYRSVDYSQPFYERVALRYYFLPNMFANMSIKAHAAKAQNIEWGVGFSL